jgi:hypothetical protein
MKVKMLTCLTGGDFVVMPGQYHECDELEASRMVLAGLATGPEGWEPLPEPAPIADEDDPDEDPGEDTDVDDQGEDEPEDEDEGRAAAQAATRETATSRGARRRGKR